MSESLNITNEDCMDLMARYSDNHFDLAIVDPPYGVDIADWDANVPDQKYFNELFRVSKNQIIWGGNYFNLPHHQGWICWHKTAGFKSRALEGQSDFELAWASIEKKARLIPFTSSGNIFGLNGGRPDYKYKPIHPTQKHYTLYQILLKDYAESGQRILDTHLGSGSIAIAVDSINKIEKMNLTLTACEIDKEYYDKAMKRIVEQTAWQSLF